MTPIVFVMTVVAVLTFVAVVAAIKVKPGHTTLDRKTHSMYSQLAEPDLSELAAYVQTMFKLVDVLITVIQFHF